MVEKGDVDEGEAEKVLYSIDGVLPLPRPDNFLQTVRKADSVWQAHKQHRQQPSTAFKAIKRLQNVAKEENVPIGEHLGIARRNISEKDGIEGGSANALDNAKEGVARTPSEKVNGKKCKSRKR